MSNPLWTKFGIPVRFPQSLLDDQAKCNEILGAIERVLDNVGSHEHAAILHVQVVEKTDFVNGPILECRVFHSNLPSYLLGQLQVVAEQQRPIVLRWLGSTELCSL